jgi:TonB family protein
MTFDLIRVSFIRPLWLLGIIAVLSSPSVLAQTTSASASIVQSATVWETYMVRGEEFSIQLPVLPAMSTSDNFIVKLNKYRRERIVGAYADGVVYAVDTYQNLTRQQGLDDLIPKLHQADPGTFKRELMLDNVRGREYVFQYGDLNGVRQFYVTSDHFYVFTAVGASLGNRDTGIPKFLASIHFAQTPKGMQLLDGPGMQPDVVSAAAGNDQEIIKGRDLVIKARIMTKPEPSYTEQARKDQITGTVVIKCVFSSSGAVKDIVVVYKLPDGLTEKAVAAAKQIRFIPAQKDGRFVSMYLQLEYNFNLY